MPYDIGPKIGIDGEAEFRQKINEVNTQIRTMGTEMDKVTSSFGKNQDSEEALTAKNEVLNRQIALQKERLESLRTMLDECKNKYGENNEKTQQWQQTVNRAETAINKLEGEVKQNNAALDDMKNGVVKAGDALDDGSKKASTFGDVLKANLTADAIKGGLQAIAGAARESVQQFTEMVSAASEYGSAVNDTAAKTGMTTDSLQQWQYAAKLCGVENEKLTSLMVKQQKSFSDASEGSKTAADAYQRLGIDIKTVGNSSDAFDSVMKKLAGMENETERNALANDIFGKSYADLTPLLKEGTSGMEEMRQKAKQVGAVMSKEAVKAADDFGDSLDTLKIAFGGLKNNLAGDFLPSITGIMDGMTMVMSGDVDAGVAAIEQGITDFGNKIQEMGPYAKQALDLVVQVISDNLPTVVACAGQVIVSLVNGLLTALPELIPAAVEAVMAIVNTLTSPENIGLLIDAAIDLAVGIAVGLAKATPQIVAEIPEIISSIISGLLGAIPDLADAGTQLITGLWNGISDMGDWIWGKISGWCSDNVLQPLKLIFGIHSPSTVMRDEIGKNLAAGVGEGFDDEMGDVSKKMAAAIPSNFDVTTRLNASLGSPTVAPAGITDMSAQMQALVAYMPQILSKLNMSVVLDDGTLVGHIAPAMDKQLGKISTERGRGR